MKFYNREEELELLNKIILKKGFYFILIKGRRRIGKTRLVQELFKDRDLCYVFVPRDKTTGIFLEEISSDLAIPKFARMSDLVRYLFDTRNYVFFDELQNFHFMEKSAYSDLQKLIDEYKLKNKPVVVFASGSSYSLIKKIFGKYAAPLYRRTDAELHLQEFSIGTVMRICRDLNISYKDAIQFWAIFGGVPTYYELLEKLEVKDFESAVKTFFFNPKTAFLKNEGREVLIGEFGGEYKTYFSALEAISSGKTQLHEISSAFGNRANKTARYLDILRKEYNLVSRMTPVTENPNKSRSGIYITEDNFLHFWFSFVKRHESYFEQGMHEEAYSIFMDNYHAHVGSKFEKFMLKVISDNLLDVGFTFTKIGRQWGKIPDAPKDSNQYEIDIVALNDSTKEVLFAECKWQDKVDAEAILEELKEKAAWVDWNNGKRKERYALFAKSFRKKTKDAVCFDLADLERIVK